MLRLPRKMTLKIGVRHIGNVISNARSNKHHPPTSPNIAPATHNCIPKSMVKISFSCRRSIWWVWPMTHSAPRIVFSRFICVEDPPWDNFMWQVQYLVKCTCHFQWQAKHSVKFGMVTSVARRVADWRFHSLCKLRKYCACHEKWISWLILEIYETLFTMCGATCVITQSHQILRLPGKMTKRKNDPTMIGPWNRQSATELTLHAHHQHFEKMQSRSGYHSTFHRIRRLPRKIPRLPRKTISWLILDTNNNSRSNMHHHQILRLPRKVTLIIHHSWNIIKHARSKKCHCPNPPNTPPATKNESRLILDTNERLFILRGATCVIVQSYQYCGHEK